MSFANRLKKGDWEVRKIDLTSARELVIAFHYAKGVSNTATELHGLFIKGFDICMGCAWWIPPTKSAALATFPENWQGVLSLSRLVINPIVPKNAATFLLARSRKFINRSKWPVFVTYADTWRNHLGIIYRADNWIYKGLTKPERVYTLNEKMIARKAGPKTRTHAEMIALGCVLQGSFSKHKYVRFN